MAENAETFVCIMTDTREWFYSLYMYLKFWFSLSVKSFNRLIDNFTAHALQNYTPIKPN
jgi:hypothetical protein